MPDGHRRGERRRFLAQKEAPPANEDFLFHLSRGSEFLVQNRVVEAKEELEQALAYRPQDAQGQDLLAGVYFRLGVYERAIEIWRLLSEDFPHDPTLRVNLGLVLFKTGQPEEARMHFAAAVGADPNHDRAWGYLGLVLWRLGRLDDAREAFLRGGQASMAQRMEESIAAAVSAATHSVQASEPFDRVDDAEVSALRAAAHEAESLLNAGEGALSLEGSVGEGTHGRWQVVETGADPLYPPSTSRPQLTVTPSTLGVAVEQWAIELPRDTPLGVSTEGQLLVQTDGAVHARLASDLVAIRGPMTWRPDHRRFRGRTDTKEVVGGDEPIVRWDGPLTAIVAPPAGLQYQPMRLSGGILFVQERFVQAFDDRIAYESGEMPSADGGLPLLSFHGEGTVVLRLRHRPAGVEVREEEEVRVDPNALVGWTGRLFPSAVEHSELGHLSLAFKGEGMLLVT